MNALSIRVVDTEKGFDELEETWNRLSDEMPPSIFSSFDYARTAWRHFHKPTDRLFLLLLYDVGAVRGIAPFYISKRHMRGIPYRAIRFIAAWEGDSPRLVTGTGRDDLFWWEILRFLSNDHRSWDMLDLVEQPPEGPSGGGGAFVSRAGWYWEREADGVDYYISLKGDWECYLSSLDSQVRREWRRQLRRLSALPDSYHVEKITQPERVAMALSRFILVEISSWKGASAIGVAKDAIHRTFYEDLLTRLATRGQTSLYLLRVGEEDIAGYITLVQRDVVYGRHVAYSPSHAVFSPGIVLQAEVIRESFEKGYREFDLLSLKEAGPPPKHKACWSTGRRETVHWTGYRVLGRLLPVLFARRLRSCFQCWRKKSESFVSENIRSC